MAQIPVSSSNGFTPKYYLPSSLGVWFQGHKTLLCSTLLLRILRSGKLCGLLVRGKSSGQIPFAPWQSSLSSHEAGFPFPFVSRSILGMEVMCMKTMSREWERSWVSYHLIILVPIAWGHLCSLGLKCIELFYHYFHYFPSWGVL